MSRAATKPLAVCLSTTRSSHSLFVASGLKLQRQPGGSHHLRATPSFGPQRQWLPRDTVARGSLLWLPARAMCVLPRWHTQPAVRPLQNSRYLYPSKARDADYLLGPRRTTRTTCSATEYHRAQSCAIALRSPAPERSSDRERHSPDVHHGRLRPSPTFMPTPATPVAAIRRRSAHFVTLDHARPSAGVHAPHTTAHILAHVGTREALQHRPRPIDAARSIAGSNVEVPSKAMDLGKARYCTACAPCASALDAWCAGADSQVRRNR